MDGYRRELRRLHPFEKVVADLTARAREKKDGLTLADVLDDIHESRKVSESCATSINSIVNLDSFIIRTFSYF